MNNRASSSTMEKTDAEKSSANDSIRKVFYWVSLLLVMGIAVLTVLDVFGIHWIPRRSWSQGISPKVIQTTGHALYHEYISIKNYDVQLTLPSGVQPTFLGVSAVIDASSNVAKTLLLALILPEDLFILAVFWLLRSMVLSTWKNPGEGITPFLRANVWRLRGMGILIALMWVYYSQTPTLILELSRFSALNDFGPLIGETLPWFQTNLSLGVAGLLLILAQVFSHGVRLQQDVEGLV